MGNQCMRIIACEKVADWQRLLVLHAIMCEPILELNSTTRRSATTAYQEGALPKREVIRSLIIDLVSYITLLQAVHLRSTGRHVSAQSGDPRVQWLVHARGVYASCGRTPLLPISRGVIGCGICPSRRPVCVNLVYAWSRRRTAWRLSDLIW